MKPFRTVSSIVTPLDRVNVDTDQIVPKQFLKLVQRTGFGRYLFFDWRFEQDGSKTPGFVLNDARYQGSQILTAGENFGCGSSREHAVWALMDYGFQVVIAPSFADIFYSNCFKNGLLPVRLPQDAISRLSKGRVDVSLESQTVESDCIKAKFDIEDHKKRILLEGLDDISQTLKHEDKIAAYEAGSAPPPIM